jgi:hypothetical protein
MGGMRADPEPIQDQSSHPRCGPDLTAKAEGFGPFAQFVGQLRQLLFGQFRGRSRRRLMSQGLRALRSRLFEPLAHCSLADPSAWAMSFCFHPCSCNSHARMRLASRQLLGGVVFLLIPPSIGQEDWLLYFSLLRSITCAATPLADWDRSARQ